MVTSLTVAPMRSGLHYYLEQQFNSFHNFPIETDLDNLNADVAILGIPFGDPYSMGEASNDQAFAPTHIRRPVSYTHLRSPRDLSTSRMPSSA